MNSKFDFKGTSVLFKEFMSVISPGIFSIVIEPEQNGSGFVIGKKTARVYNRLEPVLSDFPLFIILFRGFMSESRVEFYDGLDRRIALVGAFVLLFLASRTRKRLI